MHVHDYHDFGKDVLIILMAANCGLGVEGVHALSEVNCLAPI